MLKKMLFLAAWLMLGGLALAQEADQPALDMVEAGADQSVVLEIPEKERLVRTDLISGFSDRLSLLDFAEGSFEWLKSKSAFARTHSALEPGWDDLADLETIEQYSLVAYGPRDEDYDQWLVVIRYSHNNQKLHYDFQFAPEGDKMVLKAVLEEEAPLEGKKLKELLTEIFNRAVKLKNQK